MLTANIALLSPYFPSNKIWKLSDLVTICVRESLGNLSVQINRPLQAEGFDRLDRLDSALKFTTYTAYLWQPLR